MAEQILDVQEEIRLKLEKFNAKYKAVADKTMREKFFEEGDIVMIYLRKERIPAGPTTSCSQGSMGRSELQRRSMITLIL